MPLATEVKLPRAQRPIFPDRCVVSGESSPDEMLQFKVDSLSWSSTYAASRPDAISVVEVPVKSALKWKLRRQRMARRALHLTLVIVALVIVFNAGNWLGRDLTNLQIILAIIVGTSPLGVVWALLPPAFAVSASGSNIDYEFKSAEYAREFEALNAQTD